MLAKLDQINMYLHQPLVWHIFPLYGHVTDTHEQNTYLYRVSEVAKPGPRWPRPRLAKSGATGVAGWILVIDFGKCTMTDGE